MILWLWLSILIVSPVAGTENASCLENDPTSCRQTVREGELVPFDGQLMTPKRAATLAVAAGQCQDRIAMEVSQAVELMKIDLQLQEQLRANDKEHAQKQLDLLMTELELTRELTEPSFWEHPVLWFTLGVAATVAAVGITVAVLDATRPQVITIP